MKSFMLFPRHSASSESIASLDKAIKVTGPEFISALKDAMVEIDAGAKHRVEVHALAGFLVAFYTNDINQHLSEAHLTQLTFTFRIESVEKTRNCLLALFHSHGATKVVQTKRHKENFLVPTEDFVSYLSRRTYFRIESEASLQVTAFEFPVREAPVGDISSLNSSKQPPLDTEVPREKIWLKQDLVMANFLHFLVNMFARVIPGNLLYSLDADFTGDFFVCIKFLQETLLANPMDLRSIYERIWDQFQHLNRNAKRFTRVEDLRLYCLPIINNNWALSVRRHMSSECLNGLIDKAAFVKVCSDCIMWTRVDKKHSVKGRVRKHRNDAHN